jgi:hypothetical protein
VLRTRLRGSFGVASSEAATVLPAVGPGPATIFSNVVKNFIDTLSALRLKALLHLYSTLNFSEATPEQIIKIGTNAADAFSGFISHISLRASPRRLGFTQILTVEKPSS